LDHRVFMHFVPKYIFKDMIKALKECQVSKRTWVPYGRLLSEIFHQGEILKALKKLQTFTDAQLGTITGKVINGSTLKHMKLIKKEDYTKLNTDLKESSTVSNLMDDFPLICKEDPLDVRVNFILEHYKRTGETIKLDEIPETMYGGDLPVARKRKSKNRITLEADDVEESSEPKNKKAKKAKGAPKVEETSSDVPSIQEEVQDLVPTDILEP
jgi:hypothetical protein